MFILMMRNWSQKAFYKHVQIDSPASQNINNELYSLLSFLNNLLILAAYWAGWILAMDLLPASPHFLGQSDNFVCKKHQLMVEELLALCASPAHCGDLLQPVTCISYYVPECDSH